MSQLSLAITMGDPAGIGPELCLKVATQNRYQRLAPWATVPLLFGDADVLQRVAVSLNLPFDFPILEWRHWIDRNIPCEVPTIIQCTDIDLHRVKPGIVDCLTGEASFQFVDASIEAALQGRVDGVVTGPIHKEAWQQAGIAFPGHTELFATRTGASRSCMMLTSDEITCSFVTGHVGLCDVTRGITYERVLEVIELTSQAMSARLARNARIRVCGLNPHAGEHGLFGRNEEEEIIGPAIEEARRRGMDVVGPLPADTAFLPSLRRDTDAYVCMYHDQGLTVLKALAFERAVNVTLGLPIVRTSVDHGTALDLAWQGIADDRSMCEAYAMAASLARHSQIRIDLAAGEAH